MNAENFPTKGLICRVARTARGWSQEDLARRARVSARSIHMVESDQHVAAKLIGKIEAVFGFSLDSEKAKTACLFFTGNVGKPS
jgi:ribosome-binding protein aMBF1 (putative translation factor)